MKKKQIRVLGRLMAEEFKAEELKQTTGGGDAGFSPRLKLSKTNTIPESFDPSW